MLVHGVCTQATVSRRRDMKPGTNLDSLGLVPANAGVPGKEDLQQPEFSSTTLKKLAPADWG